MTAKCYCQHCQGGIEFDLNDLAGANSATAQCPHCGNETEVSVEAFVPQALQKRNPPPVVSPVMIIQQTATTPQNVTVELKHGFSPLGIVALILGIIATVFCWIPFLGLLVIPLAAIGLLLALIGLVIAIVNKKPGLTLLISGGALCLLSIFMAVFMTGAVTGGIANTLSSIGNAGTEWSKAGTVIQGDIQVTLGKVVNGAGFRIELRISNLSSTKKVDFTTWAAPQTEGGGGTLTDNNQNSYKRDVYWMEGVNTAQGSIYPGQTAEVSLFFEKPVENIEWLHLELPAQNFEGNGVVRFEIPKESIAVE